MISAAIIAGGKSMRMGADKASLMYEDTSFLQRAIRLLSGYSEKILISSNRQYKNINFPIINDLIINIGPMGGIYTILKTIDTQRVLIIPVDTPLLSKELISFLLDNYKEEDQITILKSKESLQMLIGIYDRSILPILEKLIHKKEYKLRELLKLAQVNILDASAFSSDFKNINTKRDFDTLKKEV